MDRAAGLASICLLLTSAAACGGGPSAGETAEAVQATQAALVRRTPIFFTSYPATPAPPSPWVTWRFGGAAVDSAGNTYALRYDHPHEGFLHVFDANGVYKKNFKVGYSMDALDYVRVNETGFAVGGFQTVDHGWAKSSKALIRRYDVTGSLMFIFESTFYDTQVTGLDLCADGRTVAAIRGSIYAFDLAGSNQWNVPIPPPHGDYPSPSKIRCLGDGTILVAGTAYPYQASPYPFVAQLASNGSVNWTWTSSDTITGGTFDFDGQGHTFVGTTQSVAGTTNIAVYALDHGGSLTATWRSNGPADTFAGIAVSNAVVVTGTRAVSASVTHFLTTKMDTSFGALWTRDDAVSTPGLASTRGVAIDSAGNVFVCGTLTGEDTAVLLYGASDGATLLSDDVAGFVATQVDVTNGVGRCIGPQPGERFALLGFQLPQRAFPVLRDVVLLQQPIDRVPIPEADPPRSPLLDPPFPR